MYYGFFIDARSFLISVLICIICFSYYAAIWFSTQEKIKYERLLSMFPLNTTLAFSKFANMTQRCDSIPIKSSIMKPRNSLKRIGILSSNQESIYLLMYYLPLTQQNCYQYMNPETKDASKMKCITENTMLRKILRFCTRRYHYTAMIF